MSDSYIRPDEDFEAFYLKYYKFVYRVCFIPELLEEKK